MIKRSTGILIILLVLSVSAYFIIMHQVSNNSAGLTPTPTLNQYLFSEDDGTLQVLRISDDSGQTVQLQHNSNGEWVIILPTPSDADQGLAEAAATQVDALSIVSNLSDQLSLADAGLDIPSYTIELTFDNNITHLIQIGTITPSNIGYYVRKDNNSLYVVRKAGIDSLLKLLTSPPYPATATPSPEPSSQTTPDPTK